MNRKERERHKVNLAKLRNQNASEEQIQQYLSNEGISLADITIDARKSGLGSQFMQGALLGGFDELSAAAETAVMGTPFRQNVREIRQGMSDFESENPLSSLGAQGAGALTTTAALSFVPGAGPAAAGANVSRLGLAARGMGLGATEGAIAGALTDNEDRARGAVQGAAFGAAIPAGVNVAGLGADVVSPAFNRAQEQIVGSVLRNMSTNPERAIQNLRTNADVRVPGSLPTTAQAARDPGLAAFETPVRGIADQSNLIAQRNIEQQQARTEMLARMARDPDTIKAAKDKRGAAALPLMDEAFDNASGLINTDDIVNQFEAIAQQEGVRTQKTVRQAVMSFVNDLKGLTTLEGEDALQDISARDLYGLRQEITTALQGRLSGESKDMRLARKQLQEMIDVIDDEIEAVAPGFQEYLSTFAQRSQPVNQMEILQDIQMRSEVATPNLITGDGVLSAAKLTSQLKGPAGREKLARLSAAQRRRINRILSDLQRSTAATAPGVKVPGSDTVKNISVATVLGKTFGGQADSPLAQALGARLAPIFNAFGEAGVQRLLVEAMLDPELSARLMTEATDKTIETFGDAVMRRAPQIFYGTAGAMAGMQQE
jgi:hypothetical protein